MAKLLWDNPVFLHEVRWWRLRGLRRIKPMAWAAGSMVIAAVYICGLLMMCDISDTIDYLSAWHWSLGGLMTLIIVLCPILSSMAIVKERELRTWQVLALSQLRGGDIFLGKWLAAFLPFLLLLLFAVPLLLVTAAQVDLGQTGSIQYKVLLIRLLIVLFCFVTTAAAYTMLGLFCSFLARKASVARILSLSISLFLSFGTLVIDAVTRACIAPNTSSFPTFDYYQGNDYDFGFFGLPSVSWLSPFYALAVLSQLTEWQDENRIVHSQNSNDYWSGHPSSVLLIYSVSLVLSVCLCFYYMLTRYRRDVREGRPLGEAIT